MLYFNRELSWLKFNERVLEEASDPATPLFERLRFLSIYSSNFDEFYMVRIGSLFDKMQMGDGDFENKTFLSPMEQINAVNYEAARLYALRDEIYYKIMEGLAHEALSNIEIKHLNKEDRQEVKEYFMRQVLPLLSPQIIDARNPFPNLENKVLYIASQLSNKKGPLFGVIPLPPDLERLYVLPGCRIFLLLEDIILYYTKLVFDGYRVHSKAVIRVTRNADMDIDDDLFEENTDYVNYMRDISKRREKLSPVRFETSMCETNEIKDFFLLKLNLKKNQSFELKSPLDLGFINGLENYFDEGVKKALSYEPVNPKWPSGLKHGNIISQIRRKDLLLSYPYESMEPFIELLREASQDIQVVSIKIALYRIDMQSLIARYLCDAAANGKEVTVEVELQARFDEQNNLHWSKILEDAGCKIVYGVEEYKVHCKIMLLTRKTDHGLEYITHIGTGNYNEKTARYYTDLGILTADSEIGGDAVKFFQNLAIGNMEGDYEHLLVSPNGLRSGIIRLIEEEIEKKKWGIPARIRAKMNSLTDKEVIDSLIAASQAGVKISLIIRGICCLKPGVENSTDNIEVRSIVGRFLEHSRIYCFGEGEDAKVYISSADIMTRNMSRRVEIAAPVFDKAIALRLINMLNSMLEDNVKSRMLLPDGTYVHYRNKKVELDSQMYFYQQCQGDDL